MTKSAEPSTPSGSPETQQRRRQITSYKNTTTSPATDRSLFPLRFLQYRQLFGAAFISARAGTDFFAANTESDLDGWLWTFDSTDCRLRHLVVAGAGIFISGQ